MNKRFQISYYLKLVLNVIIYVVFFAYIIYSAVTAQEGQLKALYIAIGVFFGGGALLYEYLRFHFDEATRQLVFMGNPRKALVLAARVKKADVLKTFDTSLDIMHMLAYVDLRDYDALEKYIAALPYEKLRNYDVAIVARHSQMVLYGERGDTEKLESAYKTLSGLRSRTGKKGRPMKGAYFYNWDVTAAMYQYYRGSGMEAWNRIQKADTQNLNKRELMHCYLTCARAALKVGRKKDGLEYAERAKKAAGKNEVMLSYIDGLTAEERNG